MKKLMKGEGAVALTVLTTVVAVGCGGNNKASPDDSADTGTAPPTPVYVGDVYEACGGANFEAFAKLGPTVEGCWDSIPSPYSAMCTEALQRAAGGDCGPEKKAWFVTNMPGFARELSQVPDFYKAKPNDHLPTAEVNSYIKDLYQPYYWNSGGEQNSPNAKALGVGVNFGRYMGVYNCLNYTAWNGLGGQCKQKDKDGLMGVLYPLFVGTLANVQTKACPKFPLSYTQECHFDAYGPSGDSRSADVFQTTYHHSLASLGTDGHPFQICDRPWYERGKDAGLKGHWNQATPMFVYKNFVTKEPIYGSVTPWKSGAVVNFPSTCPDPDGDAAGVILGLEYVADALALKSTDYNDCVKDCCVADDASNQAICSQYNYEYNGDACNGASGCAWKCDMPTPSGVATPGVECSVTPAPMGLPDAPCQAAILNDASVAAYMHSMVEGQIAGLSGFTHDELNPTDASSVVQLAEVSRQVFATFQTSHPTTSGTVEPIITGSGFATVSADANSGAAAPKNLTAIYQDNTQSGADCYPFSPTEQLPFLDTGTLAEYTRSSKMKTRCEEINLLVGLDRCSAATHQFFLNLANSDVNGNGKKYFYDVPFSGDIAEPYPEGCNTDLGDHKNCLVHSVNNWSPGADASGFSWPVKGYNQWVEGEAGIQSLFFIQDNANGAGLIVFAPFSADDSTDEVPKFGGTAYSFVFLSDLAKVNAGFNTPECGSYTPKVCSPKY